MYNISMVIYYYTTTQQRKWTTTTGNEIDKSHAHKDWKKSEAKNTLWLQLCKFPATGKSYL